MAIDIKNTRSIEQDDKGRVWAVSKDEFINGNDEKTERITRNRWKKSSIKKNKEDLQEARENFHQTLANVTDVMGAMEKPEYEEFKKRIKEGDLKEFYNAYAHEFSIDRQIKAKQIKAKSVKEHLENELNKVNKSLDELKEFENQIKQAEEYFNKK